LVPIFNAATPMTLPAIVERASAPVQLIVLVLALAAVSAVIICVVKLRSGPRLAGGSAFVSGLRFGGPLAGLLGAAWGVWRMSVGLARVGGSVPTQVLARGWAEASLLALLGLACGLLAVVANWALEARIDRDVLRG